MAIKTIDCVECGASVPYGRLSCPACGALLASVAGARRRSVRASTGAGVALDDHEVREPIPPSVDPVVDLASVPEPAPPAAAASVLAAEPIAAEPEPAAKPERAKPWQAAQAPAPMQAGDPVRVATPEPTGPVIEPLLPDEPVDAGPTLWPPLTEPAPKLSPRPYQPLEVEPYVPGSAMPPPPSAYRPPTSSPALDGPDWTRSAEPDLAATGDGPATVASDPASSNATERWTLDPARFVEIASWFAIVGAAMAILGFLLPWSRVVIGASGTGGYFDSWGLASPTHILVVLGLMAVLALEILRAPVPAWLRTGIPGLILGSLVVGLIWPYVVGRLGADIGVMVTGLGGVTLIVGGVVASWATRHGEVERVV
jgi:hypothetical protein